MRTQLGRLWRVPPHSQPKNKSSLDPPVLTMDESATLSRPISYPGECDLTVHSLTQAHRHFLTNAFCYLNMHQDTKSARLIAVCKRSFKEVKYPN